MASKNGECWEMHGNFLSNRDVCKKHELFNHIMSVYMLILRDVCWILAIIV